MNLLAYNAMNYDDYGLNLQNYNDQKFPPMECSSSLPQSSLWLSRPALSTASERSVLITFAKTPCTKSC